MDNDKQDWFDKYALVSNKLPEAGSLLEVEGGGEAVVDVFTNTGEKPVLFVRAYVPLDLETEPSWKLRASTDKAEAGVKCIIHPADREKLLMAGYRKGTTVVNGVKVLYVTGTGKGLVVSVKKGN